jgi:ABC-type transport system substrate-binding protein
MSQHRTSTRLTSLFSTALLLALTATAFTGCKKKEEGGTGTATGTTAAGGAAGKVFNFHRREAYKTLDPVKQLDQSSIELISNVYDTLLQYAYLKRPYELAPALVTKMPELSGDGLTYSFELRDDVYFHDDPCFPGGKGRKMDADDVIYSIKRFADANLNAISYSLLQGMVAGMDEFRDQTAKAGKATDYKKLSISGLTKVDQRHFTLKLTRPNPIALYPLAASSLSIVPHEAVEKYGREFETHPVGTGPFVMKRADRRGVVILERNPRYWDTYPSEGTPGDEAAGLLKAKGQRLPFIDRVELPLIEEPQPAMLLFLSGKMDWVAIDRDNFNKLAFKDAKGFHLKPEFEGKFVLYAEPDLRTEYFTFNMKDPLVGKNKALRQAIAYTIDAKAFLEQMMNGRGEVLTSIVPIQVAGSQRDIATDWYKPDPKMAAQKLAEAGFPGGKGLAPLLIEERASTTSSRQQFEFVRAELAAANITAQANFQTFSAFLQRVESGNFQMAEEAWGADYPDAENFYALLYSKNAAPGPNHAAYNNPEYDKLYEQIRSMPNGPERFALFAKMNAIIKEDLPILFTFNLARVGMHQNWVQNFKRNVLIDMPLKFLDLDMAAKARGIKK